MDDDDDENEQVSDKLDIFEDLMLNYVPKLNTVEEIK